MMMTNKYWTGCITSSFLLIRLNSVRSLKFSRSGRQRTVFLRREMASSKSNEWISLDPQNMSVSSVYKLGISTVVPRPIAVITSVNSNGIVNCAPFSYSGLFSHDPPLVATGIVVSSKGKKDTLVNIEETGEWIFNVLSESWISKANQCSAEVDSSVNELDIADLSSLPAECVKAPRVAEALVSMECKLFDKKEVFNDAGKHTTTIVIGRVVRYHVHESVATKDSYGDLTVDLKKMRFVGRAGDVTYWPAGEGSSISMKRP